ncbi:hypothetical protein ACFOKF_06020 [Sphingobium rhizovicinum]|uniref:Uncharacterized protein n=1 Tax=Sphingobium rhizovicinum TaxID=432308 RepID=A0ABV7NBX6_9SPHN
MSDTPELSAEALASIAPGVRQQRERYDFEKAWPDTVWSIGINRLDLLGVDDDGNLYWNGKPIEVRKSVALSLWQRVGAISVTLSAIVGAGAAAVSAYADLMAK